jgi:hypothetical protein
MTYSFSFTDFVKADTFGEVMLMSVRKAKLAQEPRSHGPLP